MLEPEATSQAELAVLRRRNAKLQVLLDVSKQFGAERNVDKLLAHILSEAGRIIEAERCRTSRVLLDIPDLGEGVTGSGLPPGDLTATPAASSRRPAEGAR